MRGYSVSPRVSPVCGGSVLAIEGIAIELIDGQDLTVLVCIEGSSQRHICTTFHNQKAFCCSIPEHEPAESCKLLLIFYNLKSKTIEIIPLGTFLYRTDQTQLLAVYLAQSVDDLESLEDWDEIRGEGFSLCTEDFSDLDQRLTAAFQHLLLPSNWSLLGNHKNQPTRETLYHFCARLGLVKFIRFLFTRPGAHVCLNIPNRHGELPQELAQRRDYDQLYQVFTDINSVERYQLPISDTIELDNGACLRRTEHNTVNIDIDVSEELLRRALSDDILLFSEALVQSSLEYTKNLPKRKSTESKTNDLYFRNPQDACKNIQEGIKALHLEKIFRSGDAPNLRSNSCPDLVEEKVDVQLRRKKSSDDFEVMPDAKRRSIIASHVSENLGSSERRRSWHESEHSLDRVTDSVEFIPRSRSYEHIDEPDLSDVPGSVDNATPFVVNGGDIVQMDNCFRRKSTTERRPAIIIESNSRSNKHVKSTDKVPLVKNEERLLDVRNHQVPKKLSESTSSTSSALRKGSMATLFKGFASIPGQRKARRSDAKSPRKKVDNKMPVIHSDTDTDTDNKRRRSLDRKICRNESNSSADYISRNNSLKGSQADSVDSDSSIYSDFEDDTELNATEIPDTWYAYTDQKNNPTLKDKTELKRQENIYELIYTERNHYRTLKIMQKIFIGRMRAELNFTREKCGRFFPDLDELANISREFLRRLTQRQTNEYPVIKVISDLLIEFWNSEWGERKAASYGRLCAGQHDSLKLYKEELRNNKRFFQLIQKYKAHRLTKRLDIPDCIQLVTHRLTKYPLLLENIIKNTKNDNDEKEATNASLSIIKKIAQSVDGEMEEYKRKCKLEEIIQNFERTSTTKFNDKRFTRKDLSSYQRKLVNHYDLILKDKTKSYDVSLLIMEDLLILLSGKNGKYAFFGENNSILSLQSLHYSENAKDSCGIYIMGWSHGDSDNSCLWDLKALSNEKRQTMVNQISLAKHSAPKNGLEKKQREEKRFEEMKGKTLELSSDMESVSEKIKAMLNEQLRKQKDFHVWVNEDSREEIEKVENISLPGSKECDINEVNEIFVKSFGICSKIVQSMPMNKPDDSANKLHKAETFNGFDGGNSGRSSSSVIQDYQDPKTTINAASELSMLLTKLERYLTSQFSLNSDLTNQLLLANHYSGFRGSRGVLEAEQNRYNKLYEEQKKDLEEKKQTYLEKVEKLNSERASMEKRLCEIERKENKQVQSEMQLKQKWNEYQQNAEVLRNSRHRIPTEIPPRQDTSLNSSNSNSLLRAPQKQPRPREHSSRRQDHARKEAQLPTHLKFSAVNQLTTSDPRESVRSNGSAALFDLAVSSSSSKLPTKLATSSYKGKLKKT